MFGISSFTLVLKRALSALFFIFFQIIPHVSTFYVTLNKNNQGVILCFHPLIA